MSAAEFSGSFRQPPSGAAGATKYGNTGAAANLRIWPVVLFAIALWIFYFASDFVEMSMFGRFVSRMSFNGAVLLCFLVWWLGFSRARWHTRLIGFLAILGGMILAGLVSDKTMGAFAILLSSFIFVVTLWAIWLVLCRNVLTSISTTGLTLGLVAATLLTCGFFDLVRWEGLDGGQHAAFAWRWIPTSEAKFLSEHGAADAKSDVVSASLQIHPGDWTQFRGPDRNNQVHGVKLATDWEQQPPKLLWRQRVGPGWSSMIVVDGKLFTQEQRGEQETVACYDAVTGKEIWIHQDETRFEEPLARAGPRGTPTFSDGRITTLGATGKLNCLDASTGNSLWSHDIVEEAQAQVADAFSIRQWGYSNSPLVVDGLVIVFAGGEKTKGLLAYRADNGERVWDYPAGKDGYSSPQVVSIDGQKQLLMHSTGGLIALEPGTGKLLWERPATSSKFVPLTQPQHVGSDQLLAQSENGIQLVKLTKADNHWDAAQRWDSRALKPTLDDFVVLDGAIYGFDDSVFCCVDLDSGKRLWKGGRYGSGQVLLLADQPLLFVISETGEAVIIAPNRSKLDELARFQAIEGKTWNHPVIVGNKLFVRNGEEMACYELPLAAVQ